MGGLSMNENLDLTKILKGCPVDTEFYHAGWREVVKFVGIDLSSNYPIRFEICDNYYNTIAIAALTKKGTFSICDDECLIFPSKGQRDWSKFERFWDKPKIGKFDPHNFQPFDKVLVRDFLNEDWMADFFERIYENDGYYNATCVTSHWEQCIPYTEETKHLLGTREDCPEYYKWWEE